jgi:hypothetical protein
MTFDDYKQVDNSGYGSHIPALTFIFEHVEIKTAVEYGMGLFSTSFLLDKVKDKVLSIEMQSEDWYERVINRYQSEKWEHRYTDKVWKFMDYPDCDLLLVDGSSITRAIGVVYAMERGIETIVLHDTESSWYGYHMIAEYLKKFRYFEHEFIKQAPYTKVFTINKKLIDAIKLHTP